MTQLAILFRAGVQLVPSLEILAKQEIGVGSEIISKVAQKLSQGHTLSDSLSEDPEVFPGTLISSIRLGEKSGGLSSALHNCGLELSEERDLSRKLQSATMYPMSVVILAGGFFVLLVLFFVPRMLSLLDGLQAEISPGLDLVFRILEVLMNPWIVFSIFQAGLLVLLLAVMWRRTERGRLRFDDLLLSLPLFGSLAVRASSVRFSRGLATMLRSGGQILNSVNTAAETLDNHALRRQILRAALDIQHKGDQLHSALGRYVEFDLTMLHLIAAGEESGRLERVLLLYSKFAQAQVEQDIEQLLSLIEPLVLGALGIAVGLLSLAFFLPITQVMSNL